MTHSPNEALFTAIDAGDLDVVRKLLDADRMLVHTRHVDERNQEWSPLQRAASKGKLELCRLLVERGAEVYTNPMNTYPPVVQAAWNKHTAVVKYFLEEIPDQAAGTNGLGVMLNLAAREGWIDLVRKHIALDPLAVHQRGWIGDTPLHWPAHNNFAEIVTLLLAAGADVNADEIRWIGGKPLHWASEHAPASVEVLLKHGADLNGRNIRAGSKFFGMTPLIHNATQKDDCGEITELLIAAGADVKAVDANGRSALSHATERGLVKIIEVLTRHGAV